MIKLSKRILEELREAREHFDKFSSSKFLKMSSGKRSGFMKVAESKMKMSELSSHEYYCVRSFLEFLKINSRLEKENRCFNFMMKPPSINYLKSIEVLSMDYFSYHLTYFYILSISLEDHLLSMINIVYNMGLDSRDITFQIISRSSHLKGTRILKCLKKIHNNNENNRRYRNLIIHQMDDWPDKNSREALNLLQGVDFTEKFKSGLDAGFIYNNSFKIARSSILSEELENCAKILIADYLSISEATSILSDVIKINIKLMENIYK